MSPENTHKPMGFYMEVLVLGVILQYMVSASLSCFPEGVQGQTVILLSHVCNIPEQIILGCVYQAALAVFDSWFNSSGILQ